MKGFLIYILLVNSLFTFSQNPEGFEKMCDNYIKNTVPLAKPQQLKFEITKNPDIYILDAREQKEFEISHIKGARFIGYDDFEIKSISNIPKDAKVYVYCSIGYRSEKIGEKLQNEGYEKVYNLYGGIFSWANNGYPIENNKGIATTAVHGYNKKWSKWLNTEKCQKTLN